MGAPQGTIRRWEVVPLTTICCGFRGDDRHGPKERGSLSSEVPRLMRYYRWSTHLGIGVTTVPAFRRTTLAMRTALHAFRRVVQIAPAAGAAFVHECGEVVQIPDLIHDALLSGAAW